MPESLPSRVFFFDGSDPEMQGAYANARKTFKYFWRECAWEQRRIVKGLSIATVKAPFSDGDNVQASPDHPSVEHMWMGEIDFDGEFVSGAVLNTPNWLKSVNAGDSARIPLAEINDWMYVLMGKVYGAHTVNLLRSRMGQRERKEHDRAWGQNFGDPTQVRIVPPPSRTGGLFSALFSRPTVTEIGEHPMSENMAPSMDDQLTKDPSLLSMKDENHWTQLHHLALAGSVACVKVFLNHGADPNAATKEGKTPLQLARSLDWENVEALLESRGAK